MEARLGFDFGNVRVHADDRAADAAHQLRARAMTLRSDVFFAQGEYQPGSGEGRRLLAHELTHVVQQGSAQALPSAVPTVAAPQAAVPDSVIPRERDIGESYSNADLQSYLTALGTRGTIEDRNDSDDKARTIVAAWRRGNSPFTLTTALKILLIREMQSGFTGDDDEWGILEILERSSNADLNAIFTAIPASDLNSDFHGSEWRDLQRFYARRFQGGMAALLAGTVVAIGEPLPMGTDLSLVEGLTAPSATDRARGMQAINTEVRTATGAEPSFTRTIPTHPDPWETRIRDRLEAAITSMYARLVTNRPPRTPANMLATTDIDRVAGEAQAQTDRVYHGYYSARPAYSFGTNISDAFITRDAQVNASVTAADRAVNFRVLKLLNGDNEIATINREHGAIYTRATEWPLVAGVTGFPVGVVLTEEENGRAPPHVTTGIVGTRRAELLDIHRNWSAYAGGGEIFLDRMRAATDAGNRNKMYRLFGTVIHEYIHTLEHPAHVRHRRGLAAQQGGFVLREGLTEYLAKRVWDQVDFTSALRALIEGTFQDQLDPDGHPIPLPPRYDQWENAERFASALGLRNVLAAYFLGRTDLIGA